MKAIVVTIHGQESNGKNIKALSDRLATEDFAKGCKFINIRYPRLLSIINCLPWVRKMTAKFIAARLETIKWKYAGIPVIVIAHSNGTVATGIALEKRRLSYMGKGKYPDFRIDSVFLLGCPMKRSFDWGRFPYTEATLFRSTNDKVVWWARFYGMGTAGRNGFKNRTHNLTTVELKYGHSDFMDVYHYISDKLEFEIEIMLYRGL